MLDTKHLRYFVAVAETLHFGKAALRMHITQPPLSRQIASLERALGVRLLERGTRSVVLTKAGERFHADAVAILASVGRAQDSAVATARGTSGRLSLGFNMYAAYSVVPALAKQCMARFPQIVLEIREYFSAPLLSALTTDEVDVGIMLPPPAASGFDTVTLLREPLVAALPRDHRLAAEKRITFKKLAADPFILTPREAAPALHDTIMAFCHAQGFTPLVRLEIFLQQTVVAMVGEGLGVALVPRSLQKIRLPSVVFVPVTGAPSVELVMAWRPETRNPAWRRFAVWREVKPRSQSGAVAETRCRAERDSRCQTKKACADRE